VGSDCRDLSGAVLILVPERRQPGSLDLKEVRIAWRRPGSSILSPLDVPIKSRQSDLQNCDEATAIDDLAHR
jgi:hypothetical protein